MKHIQTKRLVVVLVAIALALAVFMWLADESAGAQRDARALPDGAAPTAALVEAAGEASASLANDDRRRDVAPEPEVAHEEAPANNSVEAPAPVVVEVAVDDAWFIGRFSGGLDWTSASGATTALPIEKSRVELPEDPRGFDEFTNLRLALFAARALVLETRPTQTDAGAAQPSFVLRTELVPGAVVDWAPSVPLHERGSVDIMIGAHYSPSIRGMSGYGGEPGLSDRRYVHALPFTLPKLVAPSTLWVGAAGRQWRAYALAPDTQRVAVALAQTATLVVHHDAPAGSALILENIGSGGRSLVAFSGDAPITITDLPAEPHRVWLVHREQPISNIVRAELTAGTTEVDLRTGAELVGRGGIRCGLRAASDVLAQPHSVVLHACRARDIDRATSAFGHLVRTGAQGDVTTFEIAGLEPGAYSVIVLPFGNALDVDVVAGESIAVELELGCEGRVEFTVPEGLHERLLSWLALEGVLADSGREVRVPLERGAALALTDHHTVACGRFTAVGVHLDSKSTVGLVSDPFVVSANTTTVVPLRVTTMSTVTLVAVDAHTDEPIGLGLDFWFGVRAVGDDARPVARCSAQVLGTLGAHTGVEWSIEPHSGRVRLELPTNAYWTFEPLQAVALTDGATITLRATAK